ncbi:hypothetical protein AXK60_21315 [Tsukamurella pseudospumae]|uniref:Uncharacterized protein n=1 Tax=Tsukamurella pseudospumae TaxID=239498 RepID=A0A138AUU4_9ACTN|nr:hypothetical protein AXK60_21315 [Tsukamurella pseudospumae]
MPHLDDLVGSVVPLSRDRVTSIGRDADLSFPGNNFLHRRLIDIYWRDDGWWIENVGAWIPVRYCAAAEALSSILDVGQAMRLSSRVTHLVFRAGGTEYEVVVRIPDHREHRRTESVGLSPGTSTLGPGSLTLEQLAMLVAFCEPLLLAPGVGIDRIRSMRAVEDRLGWSSAKLRRKLDNLCGKLATAGVAGLVSETGVPATNRRIALLEWALATRIISTDSVRLLDLSTVNGPLHPRRDGEDQ